MAIDNARRFVEKMRQGQKFRKKALATTGTEDLFMLLQEEALPFNQRELVEAMAECMEQLDLNESIDASSRNKSFIERTEENERQSTRVYFGSLDCDCQHEFGEIQSLGKANGIPVRVRF